MNITKHTAKKKEVFVKFKKNASFRIKRHSLITAVIQTL